MIKQQIYNKVRDHLLAQKKRAQFPNGGTCAYITPDGLRCAIGCLIPDGHPALNSRGGVADLVSKYSDLEQYLHVNKVGIRFFEQLQDIHDYRQPYRWRSALAAFANRHGLVARTPAS
jgi:hypothetical protein